MPMVPGTCGLLTGRVRKKMYDPVPLVFVLLVCVCLCLGVLFLYLQHRSLRQELVFCQTVRALQGQAQQLYNANNSSN